jgi:hypothetical protein
LTVAGIFPGSLEAAVAEVEANFVDVIVANLHRPSTALNLSMRAKVATLQQLFRANPGAADLMKEAMKKTPGVLALNEERNVCKFISPRACSALRTRNRDR